MRIPVVRLEILLQVPDVNVAVLVGGNKQWPLATHVVHRHGDVGLTALLKLLTSLLPRPEFDPSVPPARYDHGHTVSHQAEYIFDWTLVLANRLNLLRLKIKLLYCVVSAREQKANLVDLPAHS